MRAVRWYQVAAEGRPSPCRFTPTCSSYALEALEVHGTARGLWLTLRRLVRCRPFGPSGWDPVPEPSPDRTSMPASAPVPAAPDATASDATASDSSSSHPSSDPGRRARSPRKRALA